jgi:hypothetical protein
MRTVIAIATLLLFFACNDNKAEKTVVAPPPPKYYFYPKANVYFDTVNKDYVFLGNDGRTWTSQKQIPAAMQSLMDKSVFLDSFSQPVWKDNQNHKLIYSAVLYASPADTIEKEEPRVVMQKPAAKTGTDSVEKKEKKGLRKFLDKLFGKKKRDSSEN